MDLEHDIQLNKPKSVLDGYNRLMIRGGYCDEPYAIRIDKKVFRQVDDSYFAINATDIVELLTNQELECGILTLFYMVGFLNPGLITADTSLFEKWDTLDYLTRALEGYDFYLAPYLQGVVGGMRWEFPDVYRQPSNWECGFYVMKWMLDFVLKYQNNNFPNIVPWSDERLREQRVERYLGVTSVR